MKAKFNIDIKIFFFWRKFPLFGPLTSFDKFFSKMSFFIRRKSWKILFSTGQGHCNVCKYKANRNPEISIPWDTLVALVALFEVGEDSSTKAVEDNEAAPTQYSCAAIQKRYLEWLNFNILEKNNKK